jgi:hypothetical protein
MAEVMKGARLHGPAYANELRAARAQGAVNLHAMIGADAWRRAQRSGHRPRLVIQADELEALHFTCCDGLELVLNARRCDLARAREAAIRICEHGARLVVLLHEELPHHSEFVYGVRE